jgi:hypothetical protein
MRLADGKLECDEFPSPSRKSNPTTISRPTMYPVIPAELMQSAVQLMVYFVTIAGAVLGLMVCSRA